ncbi:M48 family metallopeptidase [Parasphingopyxis algicola]|uniref:M48 family metallopeptidase n=1 Tax=Parasphingopyxis algicola TaxID=2026624 RepID=UPI001FE720B6|nr:SprT family zinc-dependent metalloprotease [Parasphingopyxis algicola]
MKRHPRARSFRLRVDPRDGRVLLSLPQRSSLTKARQWAETQRDWIEGQLAKLPGIQPIEAGGTVPYRGRDRRIDWAPGRLRTPKLDDDRLTLGGPEEAIGARVLRWLKAEARRILEEETLRYARRAGVEIGRISIGDARSRWGSCAASGNIRYSWRLVMAPPDVLSATAAHEVAHRVHMHHGSEFHALVAEIFGRDPAPERAWLRENGAALYWVGSSS